MNPMGSKSMETRKNDRDFFRDFFIALKLLFMVNDFQHKNNQNHHTTAQTVCQYGQQIFARRNLRLSMMWPKKI